MKRQFALALLATVVAGSAFAEGRISKEEKAIQTRQAGYHFMAWNMGKIKDQLDAPATFDKAQVAAAAKAISAIANSGMGALYLPGTDKKVGNTRTEVKPALFTDKEGVAKVAKGLSEESIKLESVAATGDVEAIRAQFGKVGAACKACHDDYRMKD
jgi:cytochrome c556